MAKEKAKKRGLVLGLFGAIAALLAIFGLTKKKKQKK